MFTLEFLVILACCALLVTSGGVSPVMVMLDSSSQEVENTTTPGSAHNACGIRPSHSAIRIVGGNVAPEHSWPWFAALFFDVTHLCGATLIDSQWAVTAAHCFFIQGKDLSTRPPRFRLKLGAHILGDGGFPNEPTQQIVPVKRVFLHPELDRADFAAGKDIALVKLAYKVSLNENVAPICVSKAADARADDSVVAIGYGTQKEGGNASSVLREVSLNVVLQEECQKIYDTIDFPVAGDAICAGGYNSSQTPMGVCNGDSGGPLMKQDSDGIYNLLGVVSWSYGCALSPYPGVYTQITAPLLKWIQDTVIL